MTTEQVIIQDPEIHGGLPVFTGTRVPVKSVIFRTFNPLCPASTKIQHRAAMCWEQG